MKRNNPTEVLTRKRQAWIERTQDILGCPKHEAEALLSLPRKQSIRLNPLVPSVVGQPPEWLGEQYPWIKEGFRLTVPVMNIRDEPQVTSGKVFIQNAASWLPVLALEPQQGEVILDVCAAPGGKTSHIAAITDNKARIYANDNSRARLAKLQTNMKRLGVTIDRYTLFDATRLSQKLEGQLFDKILLDAPCSGEGLMNLQNDKDFASWSVAHIKRLSQLQKRILTEAWRLLKPGGTLVYSTCTMAPEENEVVINYLLKHQADAEISSFDINLSNKVNSLKEWNGKIFSPEITKCLRLAPSEHIEAFFVCKLTKRAED